MSSSPRYLDPYLQASRRHGAGFGSLLWAGPQTQSARFEAFRRLHDFNNAIVLDVGCGRADFLDHLLDRRIVPSRYIGIEAIAPLADAAERKHHHNSTIIQADFVREPVRLFVGADVVVISGALNTLDGSECFNTLRRAFDASTYALIFNFLASPMLAGQDYLAWYEPEAMLRFAKTLSDDVTLVDDYLPGDCTLALRKSPD